MITDGISVTPISFLFFEADGAVSALLPSTVISKRHTRHRLLRASPAKSESASGFKYFVGLCQSASVGGFFSSTAPNTRSPLSGQSSLPIAGALYTVLPGDLQESANACCGFQSKHPSHMTHSDSCYNFLSLSFSLFLPLSFIEIVFSLLNHRSLPFASFRL